MANYATITDLKNVFGTDVEVSHLTKSYPVVDDAIVTSALESAEADINSRIGQKFLTGAALVTSLGLAGVPGSETVTLLKRKALELAEVLLLQYGGRLSDTKERQLIRVLEWADGVGSGKYVLTGAATVQSTAGRDPLFDWSGGNEELESDWPRTVNRYSMSQL